MHVKCLKNICFMLVSTNGATRFHSFDNTEMHVEYLKNVWSPMLQHFPLWNAKKKKKKTTICATLDVKRGRKQMNEGWFTFCLLRDKYHEKGRESVEQPDFTYLTALKCMRNIWKTWVPCFSIFHCKIRSKYCTCNVIF